ncbi:MAG: type II toxin-antitoxin system RelE/ParE family toxin [Nitrospirae bacterium]|nr:type II toxin-antitoxin system RelE/ParE family toxin [Nitrospirota bacterium]
MQFLLTQKALKDYQELSVKLQETFDKQLAFLLQDMQHPSLRAKKFDESKDVWQARMNRDYRMYFQIIKDTYVILSIIKHPK